MVRNDRWIYIGGDTSNRVEFRHCMRICSDVFDLVSVRFLQRFFRGRRASRSSLTNSLVSNESIKSDAVQIVAMDYLSFYQTEIGSL